MDTRAQIRRRYNNMPVRGFILSGARLSNVPAINGMA
jgi:hypothetical protein